MQKTTAGDQTAKPDLRERRRLRTMETIRKAAMTLVAEYDLDHVTAEMIAEKAGISPRTFFNYFTYKEETLIPPPLGFLQEASAAFVAGNGPILEDLVHLLEDKLVEMEQEKANIRVIMRMSDAHPRLQSVRERTFRQYDAEFRALLGQRLGLASDHHTVTLMAAVISASFRVAMCRWIENDNGSMIEALRATLAQLPSLFDNISPRRDA